MLEESVSKMGALSTSVEKLALSMESMVREQENGWKLWRAAMESCGVRPSAMQ